MKLDARDSLTFTVVVFNEGPLLHLGAIYFASGSSFCVTEHLEIVLEHIDDFIRLERLFNAELDLLNEFVKLLLKFLSLFLLLFSQLLALFLRIVPHKVVGVVLDSFINASAKVGL